MNIRGFRYKLEPRAAQEELFRRFAGVCRLVYNLALEQRRDFYRQFQRSKGVRLGYVAQAAELTFLRKEFDWIGAVNVSCQQQALRDLDRAFQNFFDGRAGYPTPRCKGRHESFRFPGREVETKRLNGKWSAVRLPKIGWVKYRDTRPLRGILKNVTVSRDALGWCVSFACEVEARAQSMATLPSVGIDRGIANTLMLSTGEAFQMPPSLAAIEQRRRRLQRAVARKRSGSVRRSKALQRVAKLGARMASIRRDFQHKAARSIAGRFSSVTIEALRIGDMTASARGSVGAPGHGVRQKAGLNRAILNQGWGGFETILAYKLSDRGGKLVTVDPAYTSQTCSACGAIDSKSRESQARFCCRQCGFAIHADQNAAVNILRRNTASMCMEDGRQSACEVRTQDGLRLV
jgi:putative transposase